MFLFDLQIAAFVALKNGRSIADIFTFSSVNLTKGKKCTDKDSIVFSSLLYSDFQLRAGANSHAVRMPVGDERHYRTASPQQKPPHASCGS